MCNTPTLFRIGGARRLKIDGASVIIQSSLLCKVPMNEFLAHERLCASCCCILFPGAIRFSSQRMLSREQPIHVRDYPCLLHHNELMSAWYERINSQDEGNTRSKNQQLVHSIPNWILDFMLGHPTRTPVRGLTLARLGRSGMATGKTR